MDNTNAQRQARWRARQKAKFAALESALRQAQAAPPPKTAAVVPAKRPAFSSWSEFKAEGLKTQNALLQMKITELRRALKQAQAAKAPASEVAAENAKLKKDNERLQQRIQEWQGKYSASQDGRKDDIQRISKMKVMPLDTSRAIAKALHSDKASLDNESDERREVREHALRLFNDFRGRKS